MKKIIAFLAAAALMVSMTACGTGEIGGPQNTSPVSSQTSSKAAEPKVDEANVEDSLKGLQQYLKSQEMVQGDPVDMQASFIGAKAGVKYNFSYEGKNNVTVELYEYDTASLDETAQKTIDSVKKDGKFKIMGRDVNAVLTDSGKYLMVYNDTANGDKNAARKKEAQKLFQAFKK